jgi:ATP-dependent DNA helicase RecQ
VVRHVVESGDALVVMPTGAGKSLCYQLPALALGGVAIVVSPLIALMKDQAEGLSARGVRATLINSTLTPEERKERLRELVEGSWEVVFVAPERFNPGFLERIKQADIRLFAIDEAHCLSQWGHDFRPDYLRLGHVRRELLKDHQIRTIALTATATPEVQADILRTIGIEGCRKFIRGFDRTNLQLSVQAVANIRKKDELLPGLCEDGTTLVYCSTRKSVERATAVLRSAGVMAGMYHAGLDIPDRTAVQDAFMEGRVPVVVATNAFGMGVDKADVRTIIHYDIPGTVEAYYQEIGRAGRDGLPSRVYLLFKEEDRKIQEFFIDAAHPPADWVRRIWDALESAGENPVFKTLDALAQALPQEAGERAAASCLYILQREGWVRRISPTERPGMVRFTGRLAETSGLRHRLYSYLRGFKKDQVGIWPDRIAEELDLSREQVTAALRGLEDRGVLQYSAPERAGGVELLRSGEKLSIDEDAIRRRRERELLKLQRMVDYAYSGCRRRYILDYFGDTAPYERCGDCDACRAGRPLGRKAVALSEEQRTAVRKVLACVARLKTPYSPTMVAMVLTGSQDEKLALMKLNQLSTYGILSELTIKEVEGLIEELGRAGALLKQSMTRTINGRERSYLTVSLTELGWKVMRDAEAPFEMVWPRVSAQAPIKTKRRAATLQGTLQTIRKRLAKDNDLPLQAVAPDRSLEELARVKPATRQAMLGIVGLSEEKVARFGEAFLKAIRGFGVR